MARARGCFLLVPAQVEAMQKLYGHDPELHYLMSAVKLLRDETALMRQARARLQAARKLLASCSQAARKLLASCSQAARCSLEAFLARF
jgi:hypothetical protein